MASGRMGSLIGRKFGVLTVIALEGRLRDKSTVWRARCQCGKEISARREALTAGRRKSCGCIGRRELEPPRPVGQQATERKGPVPRRDRPEYAIWLSMRARCSKNRGLPRYYGRGIRVCDRWQNDFDAFFSDMGPRPSSRHCIDRIDNDGNYEPSNCRWATYSESNNNKSFPGQSKHEIFGELYTTGQLAHKFGLDSATITNRLRLGWTIERACMVPVIRKTEDRPKPSDVEAVMRAEMARGGPRLNLIK